MYSTEKFVPIEKLFRMKQLVYSKKMDTVTCESSDLCDFDDSSTLSADSTNEELAFASGSSNTALHFDFPHVSETKYVVSTQDSRFAITSEINCISNKRSAEQEIAKEIFQVPSNMSHLVLNAEFKKLANSSNIAEKYKSVSAKDEMKLPSFATAFETWFSNFNLFEDYVCSSAKARRKPIPELISSNVGKSTGKKRKLGCTVKPNLLCKESFNVVVPRKRETNKKERKKHTKKCQNGEVKKIRKSVRDPSYKVEATEKLLNYEELDSVESSPKHKRLINQKSIRDNRKLAIRNRDILELDKHAIQQMEITTSRDLSYSNFNEVGDLSINTQDNLPTNMQEIQLVEQKKRHGNIPQLLTNNQEDRSVDTQEYKHQSTQKEKSIKKQDVQSLSATGKHNELQVKTLHEEGSQNQSINKKQQEIDFHQPAITQQAEFIFPLEANEIQKQVRYFHMQQTSQNIDTSFINIQGRVASSMNIKNANISNALIPFPKIIEIKKVVIPGGSLLKPEHSILLNSGGKVKPCGSFEGLRSLNISPFQKPSSSTVGEIETRVIVVKCKDSILGMNFGMKKLDARDENVGKKNSVEAKQTVNFAKREHSNQKNKLDKPVASVPVNSTLKQIQNLNPIKEEPKDVNEKLHFLAVQKVGSVKENKEKKLNTCMICKRQYMSFSAMKAHIKKKHLTIINGIEDDTKEDLSVTLGNSSKEEIKATDSTGKDSKVHELIVSNPLQDNSQCLFTCSICASICKTIKGMKLHIDYKHPGTNATIRIIQPDGIIRSHQ